jgi:hypothetical protein
MPVYRVTYERVITERLNIDVEANSPDEAIRKSYDGSLAIDHRWSVVKTGLITPVYATRLDLLQG